MDESMENMLIESDEIIVPMSLEYPDDISPEDLEKLCRLCGNYSNQLMSIFTDDGSDHNLPKKIEEHLPIIEITENDTLPSNVCYQCASTLISWHELYHACKDVDQRLKDICEKLRCKSDNVEKLSTSSLPLETENSAEKITYDCEISCEPSTENERTDKRAIVSEVLRIADFASTERASSVITSYSPTLCPKALHGTFEFYEADEFLVDVSELALSNVGAAEHVDSSKRFVCASDDLKTTTTTTQQPYHHFSQEKQFFENELPPDVQKELNLKPSKVVLPSDEKFELADRSTRVDGQSPVFSSAASSLRVPSLTNSSMFQESYKNAALRGCDAKSDGVQEVKTQPKNTFKCNVCEKLFANKNSWLIHIEVAHGNVPDLGVRLPKLKREISEETLDFVAKHLTCVDNVRCFKCDECSYHCRGVQRFVRHSRRHMNKNPTCGYCDKVFSNKGLLVRHITVVHLRIKRFGCDICGKCFGDRRHMEDHKNLHDEERKYMCEICGKMFRQRQSVVIHKQLHRGKKTFQCSHCGKAFTFRSKLLNHMKQHTGGAMSVCNVCGKKFTNSTYLRMHSSSHSTEKQFSCDICSKKLKTIRSLKQHKIIFHSAKNGSSPL